MKVLLGFSGLILEVRVSFNGMTTVIPFLTAFVQFFHFLRFR